MVGSLLFAVGVVPAYGDAVGASAVGSTFFLGSLFFTSAGYLQYVQVINTRDRSDEEPLPWRWFAVRGRRIDWWAATVQSVGTLLFNISTFAATLDTLSSEQAHRLVWAPDMFGSVAFLIASSLAWWDVCHRVWCFRLREVSWWIVAANLFGSVAFQISAITAFIDPSTGEIRNVPVSNLGTFVGAVCFFVGAFLLLPEARSAEREDEAGA